MKNEDMEQKYHRRFSWELLREEALETAQKEPILRTLLESLVLKHPDFGHALAALLANQCLFIHEDIDLHQAIREVLKEDKTMVEIAICDLMAIVDKDPAADHFLEPFLFYKGYHSLELYRIAHKLWLDGQRYLASYIQSRVSQLYGVDIHPAAQIGRGIFIDHATGLVVGETAIIEDNVSILHGVTLGGTGKETGRRHPTIRKDCLLGAHATVLGNIVVDEGSVIGAGSVVLHSVPAHSIAAGVPAVNKGTIAIQDPSNSMDQIFDDYVI
ncbi:MAG: serine O-acetyltransferase [Tannerellaceae bacterium]|jgi:serine O-acetyltransferase|nr:serine O-acetyltransferase [Tannerellaceae bacterium]